MNIFYIMDILEVEVMGLNEIIKIGDSIKKLRIAKGITQKEMAKELNIPYSTYSNYENNNRTPSVDTIATIADKLDVDINDLFPVKKNNEEYFYFLDIFLGWATSRGFSFDFSHDDETFVNNGGQSVFIIIEDKRYEFTAQEMETFSNFLYTYFDVKLMEKKKATIIQ